MPRIVIPAPAKLNLHLYVGDKRMDGFHDIESLFFALAFGDTLSFETIPRQCALEITMNEHIKPYTPIPLEENIIFRAVSLFRERTGYDAGFHITVEKYIPPGGGLGGGSSNAAAALNALNRLAAADGALSLAAADLAALGAVLGSDVPFFLCGAAAAWVSGRGERLQPLALSPQWRRRALVLVNPGFSRDTAAAYHALDEQRCRKSPPPLPSALAPPLRDKESLLRAFSGTPAAWPFTNDFVSVCGGQDIIAALYNRGADFAGLSGSGSTCFGVFSAQRRAEEASESLKQQYPFVTTTRNY